MSGGPEPTLCVVIPVHSRVDLLRGALDAVAGWPTLVVDDSPDGLPVEGAVRTAGGVGFARACNLGLARAQERGFDWVLLLNDDARPMAGCVGQLLDVARSEPRVGAVGPVLLSPQGDVESAGIRVSTGTGRVKALRRPPPTLQEVDALSGACLLIRAWTRFDPAFAFSFEDIDLALRLRRGGARVLLVPQARCVHLGGGTVPRRSRRATRLALAGHLRLLRGRPWLKPVAVGLALAQGWREGPLLARTAGVLEALLCGPEAGPPHDEPSPREGD